jgi:para-nitrobenzyl esterase
MKNILTTLVFSFIVAGLSAQINLCDGFRYLTEVFPTVKKTTVVYAPGINYAGNTFQLSADIYEPEGDGAAARPVVILAHGGSFIAGDKSMMKPYCELLAKRGYIAVSIQYHLWNFVFDGFPDSIKIMDTALRAMGDMKAAARYFREDAATTNLWKADANNIFFGGYSAGAVAALHAGFLDVDDVLPDFLATNLASTGGINGNAGSATNQTYPSDCKAVISMSGGIYRNFWLNTGEIPLTSVHGTADATVNYTSGLAANIAYLEGSNLIHQRANAEGITNYLETVPGAGHTDLYSSSAYAAQLSNFWVEATKMMEKIICTTTSTQESEVKMKDWTIAPNPTSGIFSIDLPVGVESANVLIFNQLGQNVIALQNVQSKQSFDVSKLQKGIYTVRILSENNKGFQAKNIVIE